MHEIQHINGHDAYIKLFVQILTRVLWWYPFIFTLPDLTEMVLELRVDYKTTRKMEAHEIDVYNRTITSVLLKLLSRQTDQKIKSKNSYSSHYITDAENMYKYRSENLVQQKRKVKTNPILIACLILMTITAYAVVFEPYYEPDEEGWYSISEIEENGFIIVHDDGTYTVWIDENTMFGTLTLPIHSLFENLPVYGNGEQQ